MHWDATGSIVDRIQLPHNEMSTKFLLYTLLVRHPVQGNIGLPVFMLVTTDQSTSMVSHWLTSFQRAKGLNFGLNNLSTPKLMISDRSLVLLGAGTKEFCMETMTMYLERCYRIVNGTASHKDLELTIFHTCK